MCETFPRLVCVEDRMPVCHLNDVEVEHTPCGPPWLCPGAVRYRVRGTTPLHWESDL